MPKNEQTFDEFITENYPAFVKKEPKEYHAIQTAWRISRNNFKHKITECLEELMAGAQEEAKSSGLESVVGNPRSKDHSEKKCRIYYMEFKAIKELLNFIDNFD